MNRDECRAVLLREGVREDAYDLNGERIDNTYTIDTSGGMWRFYYFERGHEFDVSYFATESEACEHLLAVIRRVPFIRK